MDGITLPFPENLSNWVSRSQYFQDMTLSDIEDYLSKNNDKKSAKEGKNLAVVIAAKYFTPISFLHYKRMFQ